ncbi:MAG: hypothetical protein SFV53_06710 [Rickettsiales bacterium]|nr:hypothetical protein [Rickettsiales bacterium]
MSERLICGDCKKSSEIKNNKRGSALIEFILWITLLIPAPIYAMWRKSKPKRICQNCGSDFLIPDTPQNREFIKPIQKNKIS